MKHWKVSNVAGRDMKTDIFQQGRAGFKVAGNLNGKVHHDGVSIYVQNVDANSVKHKYNRKGYVVEF
jgi:hypothetical protein